MAQKREDQPAEPGYGRKTSSRPQSGHSSQDLHRSAKQSQQDASEGGPTAYDVPEVLRRLSVTRPTIYRFLRSGELRSFRLGSRRLISSEALADFIRARESAEAG